MSKIKKKYFAIGLNDSIPAKRTAGELSFEGSSLIFTSEDYKVNLPYQGIVARRGGSGNSLIFFEHKDEPGWSIYTSDKSILKNEILQTNSSFSVLNKSRKKEFSILLSIIIILALSITGMIYGFYFFKETITYFFASQIPISWEKKLGKTVFSSMSQGKKIYKEKGIIDKLNPIIKPLLDSVKDSNYEFEIFVMEDSRINAFAMPGGIIVIHTELIKKADNAEEIAGVLAHEISHVTEKHGMRQLINSVGIFLVVQTLFGDFSGLLAILTQNSGLLLTSKFSRDYEREADAKGFNILINSNINPQGMVDFFKKINETVKSEDSIEGEDWFEFISTHPGTEERIHNIEKEIEIIKERKFNKISIDLNELKKSF